MPFGIIHHFPGGTQQQYEASIAAVHPSRDQLPEGQTFHAAGGPEQLEEMLSIFLDWAKTISK